MSTMIMNRPSSHVEAWAPTPNNSIVFTPPPTMRSSYSTTSPSLGAQSVVSNRSGRLVRPKSTPACLRSRHSGVLSKQQDLRPRTALGNTSDCERVLQLEHESTRKHNLESHLSVRKSRPPPWQKTLDGSTSPYLVAPGYILSRSKSKILMQIKTDEFFDPEHPDKRPKKDPDRDAADTLMNRLQQQIDDLSLYLEEERLNHRETKRQAAETLSTKLEEFHNMHNDEIRQLEEKYQTEIDRLKMSHNDTVRDLQAQSDHSMAKVNGEMEFLQGAFESYRSQVQHEIDDKWKKKEHDLKIKHQEEMQAKMHELRTRIVTERNGEKADLAKLHQREIQKVRLENKKEMEGLIQRFSNQATDVARLKEAETQLEAVTEELTNLKKNHESVCRQFAASARDLADTKVRVLEFEHNFHNKVQEVDDKYCKQIHDLMEQNTALRRLYVKKCGELFDEKQVTEQIRTDQLHSVKESMKDLNETRKGVQVHEAEGVITHNPFGHKTKDRPVSAPATNVDEDQPSTEGTRPKSHMDVALSAGWILDTGNSGNQVKLAKTQDDLEELFIWGAQISPRKDA